MIYEDARVRQPYVIRDHLAPSRRAGQEQAAALQVLSDVLGDGINSRLQQSLVVNGDAIAAGAWYSGDNRDYGELSVYATPRPGVDLEEMEAALDKALEDFLASGGPTEAEMKRIKANYRAAYVYAQDSQFGLAQRYGEGLASDLTLEQIEGWPDALQAVTAEEVMQAAQEVLDKKTAVIGWLRAPEGAEPPAAPAGAALPAPMTEETQG